MAAGGNAQCPAQEPVNAYIAVLILYLILVPKGVRTFAHILTVVKQASQSKKMAAKIPQSALFLRV